MAKGNVPERVSEQRKDVVEQIIKDMQTKGLSWSKDWSCAFGPHNPLSGTEYRGGNRMHLAAMSMVRGYDDPRWVTFNQAKAANWKLKKGAKSCIVEKWKSYTISADNDIEDEDNNNQSRTFLKCVGYWSVFNVSEFDNAPEYVVPEYEPSEDEVGRIADGFISTSRCEVNEVISERAYYTPAYDRITVPLRGQFSSNDSFIRVLWHEMAHSTAHEGTPAARIATGRFGSPDYAFEELIAELGSLFVANEMRITSSTDETTKHYEQHVAYLKSWMRALHEDPSYLFKAAAHAEKAADYLIKRYNGALEEAA